MRIKTQCKEKIFIEGFLLLKKSSFVQAFPWHVFLACIKTSEKNSSKKLINWKKMKTYVISKMKKICRLNFYAPIYTPEMNMNCGRPTDDELKKYENNFIKISSRFKTERGETFTDQRKVIKLCWIVILRRVKSDKLYKLNYISYTATCNIRETVKCIGK